MKALGRLARGPDRRRLDLGEDRARGCDAGGTGAMWRLARNGGGRVALPLRGRGPTAMTGRE